MTHSAASDLVILKPDWPAPASICSAITTRQSGDSRTPYDSLNLGDHVGDDPERVARNRQCLMRSLKLPAPPLWLQQVHGNAVWQAGDGDSPRVADAIISRAQHAVCAILTADCLPLLLCSSQGDEVAAIHAGWRGLAKGIIQNTVQQMRSRPQSLLAWLGPAIGPAAYEVDRNVRDAFVDQQAEFARCFSPNRPDHWKMDIYAIARQALRELGVTQVYGGQYCTYTQTNLFYSHRRSGITGRMASLIWIR